MRKLLLSGLVAAPLAFAAGWASAPKGSTVHAETKKNLDTAMHGEAFAHVKYLLYAEHARANGHAEVAQVFERAAKAEQLDHFRKESELAGLVGNDADNLREAIKGEDYEQSTMYPQFARQAKEHGDEAAAAQFSEIAQDERKHRDAFQAALDKLEKSGKPSQARESPTKR